MSHRGEDSDVDGGGLLTCCTFAGLPPAPLPPLLLPALRPAPPPRPPPAPLPPPLRLRLTGLLLRAAAGMSARRSNVRRSDAAWPDDGSRAG